MSLFFEHQHNCIMENGPQNLWAGSNDLTAGVSNDFFYKIDGQLYGPKTASNLASLVGITVATGFKMAIAFYIDVNGVVTAEAGDEIAVSEVFSFKTGDMPINDDYDKALIGFLLLTNTSGAPFIGGTTQLSAPGISDVYIDAYGREGV